MKRQRTAEALDFLVPLEARGARELEGRAGVNVAVVTSQLLGRVAPVDSLAFPLNPPRQRLQKNWAEIIYYATAPQEWKRRLQVRIFAA